MVRALVLAGDLPVSSAHKVVDACAGLDVEACGRVDAELAPRLAGMDPARVTGAARRVAARVAAGQVAAQAERARRGRTVQVRPSVDGLTEWYATLPTATSAAAWSAVDTLAAEYRDLDATLSVPESRADAFGDLLLRNVAVTAQVTLGVPVVTGVPEATDAGLDAGLERVRVDRDDDETVMDAVTGELTRFADLDATSREEMSWVEIGPAPEGDLATVLSPVSPRLRGLRGRAARPRLGRRRHRGRAAQDPPARGGPSRHRGRHRHPALPHQRRLPATAGDA